MLLRAAILSRTSFCGIAILVIASSTSGCGRWRQHGGDTRTPTFKSYKAGDLTDVTCEVPDDDDFPPSTSLPVDGTPFSNYANNVCFAGDNRPTNKGNWSDVRVTPPTSGIQLLIMPEVRMRHTNPITDTDDGQGMVVALVRNLDAATPYFEQATDNPNWKVGKKLEHQQDALIWLSKDQNTAVLFSYDESGNIKILSSVTKTDKSAWSNMNVNRSGNPRHAQARWVHPPQTGSGAADNLFRQQGRPEDAGTGWVTCLAGCCTPNGLLVVE